MNRLTLLSFLLALTLPASAQLGLVERFGESHAVLPPVKGDVPDPGKPTHPRGPDGRSFEEITITRISDVRDVKNQLESNYPYEGRPGRGLHNGYSKYSCANVTGEYIIAYGVQPNINMLYRRDGRPVRRITHQMNDMRVLGLGEAYDVRWDLSGRPGTETDIIYRDPAGDALWRQNALTGRQQKIFNVPGWVVAHEGHADQSTDARWRGVKLERQFPFKGDLGTTLAQKLVLADLNNGKHYDFLHAINRNKEPNTAWLFDISPSGKWFMVVEYGQGVVPARFYSIDSIVAGKPEGKFLPTISFGHDGWAFDRKGNEVFIYQDNKTDWFSAFNPASGENIRIFNQAETGWKFNQHMGKFINPAKKGWLVMSSYGEDDASWSHNQLFLVEIRPNEEHPRLIRLAHTQNRWSARNKGEWYFAETFANVDPSGNGIYWGSNWLGTDNLELYRLTLPEDWEKRLP